MITACKYGYGVYSCLEYWERGNNRFILYTYGKDGNKLVNIHFLEPGYKGGYNYNVPHGECDDEGIKAAFWVTNYLIGA